MRYPKKRNSKRRNPRYFLHESVEDQSPDESKPSWEKYDKLMSQSGATEPLEKSQSIDKDGDTDDLAELLDMLIAQIREGDKTLFGSRDLSGDLMSMTIGQLRDILWDQGNSYEQAQLDKQTQIEDDAELGFDDEVPAEESMPKQVGMGRFRALKEQVVRQRLSLRESTFDHPMQNRAKKLAQQGMERQITGEVPPWESEDQEGDGFTDVSLEEADFDVLKDIQKHLDTVMGGGNRGARFAEIMGKLGIDLGESLSSAGEAPDVDADEMEASLGRFQGEADRQAWRNKAGNTGPREI